MNLQPAALTAVADRARAQEQAERFAAWAQEEATPEQRGAVIRHVQFVDGDWEAPGEMAFVLTDLTDKAPARTVATAFTQWQPLNDGATPRTAVYGKDGTLLYADQPKG